jgi:hypothetical protein
MCFWKTNQPVKEDIKRRIASHWNRLRHRFGFLSAGWLFLMGTMVLNMLGEGSQQWKRREARYVD